MSEWVLGLVQRGQSVELNKRHSLRGSELSRL